MKDIKVKTTGGKAIHYGLAYPSDGQATSVCPQVKNSTLVEVSADTEVTCKHCVKGHVRTAPVEETSTEDTISDPIAPVEDVETIRISVDMEAALTSMAGVFGVAVGTHVTWGAGKLLLTQMGRRVMSWYMETRAESARKNLRTARNVYPAQRAEWHAAVKLGKMFPGRKEY